MGKVKQRIQKFWNCGWGRMVLGAFCAHSVSISIGICQGYSAILIPQLTASEKYRITTEEASWLAGLGAMANPIGSILSGLLAEYFGRKLAIQVTAIPFMAGWLFIAFAQNIEHIYIGRLITGVASGMASASYTYVSEISTRKNRGYLQSLGPINASFGILLTYIFGYIMPWYKVALISIAFCVLTLVSVHFLPESPEYLIQRNKCQESFQAYLWYRRSNSLAQGEIEKHGCTLNSYVKNEEETFSEVYLSRRTLKPFFILIVLFLLQELSGIYSILFYTVTFFQESGLKIEEFLSSIIVGVIRFVMSIVVAFLLTQFGRKTLCIVSSLGMAATILPLAIQSRYTETFPSRESFFPNLPLFSVTGNVFFSMVGMLPIPYILVGEYFPLKTRSIMSGVVICTAQCFIFVSVKIYPDMISKLNFSGTLMTFFAASVLSVVYCKYALLETKDKSLEEIGEKFKNTKYFNGKLEGVKNESFISGSDTPYEVFRIKVHE